MIKQHLKKYSKLIWEVICSPSLYFSGKGSKKVSYVTQSAISKRRLTGLISRVKEEINQQTLLEYGWDGYHGIPVDISTAKFAQSLVENIYVLPLPKPVIVPGCDGAVQIVWHVSSYDVEISIYSPNEANAWRINNDTGIEEEITLNGTEAGNFYLNIVNWITDLSYEWKNSSQFASTISIENELYIKTTQTTVDIAKKDKLNDVISNNIVAFGQKVFDFEPNDKKVMNLATMSANGLQAMAPNRLAA